MTKVKQFSNKFDVHYSRKKQSIDWGNTVPQKYWSTLLEGF